MVKRKTFQVLGSFALLILCSWALNAQEKPAAARMRALNNSLLELHGQMQRAAPNEVALLHSQAAKVIAERAAALSALIQQDARQGLSFAFSPELLADLATKFPNSARLLESHVTVSGPVEHWIIDYPDKSYRSLVRVKVGGKTLNLYFAGHEPNLKTGDVVQATGVVVGSEMAVSTSSTVQRAAASTSTFTATSTTALAATNFVREPRWPILVSLLSAIVLSALGLALYLRNVDRLVLFKQWAIYGLAFVVFVSSCSTSFAQTSTCSTTGVQNTPVLLVTFPGATPPSNITPQSVYDMFFSPTGPSVDGYWREASYGQTSATGNVFGWYTLDSSYANCGRLDLLRDAAITAATSAGVKFQNYQRIFIVTTDFGCGWTGLSMGGCTTLNSPTGSFTASVSFLDASWQRSQAEGAENAAHEGGHNMGLAHAQSRTFGTEPLGPLGAAGTLTEYGDPFSDMSASNSGHYAAPHKAEILNWISSGANYQMVQSSGTWTLQPFEMSPAGLVALKVQRGTGNNPWLWIEYRQPIGIYESIWAPSGALIHYEDSTTGGHTQLLDFTPATSSMFDSALMPPNTWVDPYTNVSITVQSAPVSGLTVSVNYGATPCTHANPTMTITPLNPSIYPGNSASYALSVTNNDAAGCASSTFNLGSTQPSGWPTSFSASWVTLSPGQSASVTMGKTGPLGTPPGTYKADANAANGSFLGSGTANVTVMAPPPPLTVTVSVPGLSYPRPSTVPITAAVLNGSNPAGGASVTFTVTQADGTKVTKKVTAASTGIATWSYHIGPKDPTGTVSVTAQATYSSQTATSNTVTFTVQ